MTWHNEKDRQFHYSDHSHNWTAPPGVDQDVWSELVRGHMQGHLANLGEPPAPTPRRAQLPRAS